MKSRILEIMENSGLSPSEFADKIEVQRSAISHITSGRNNPSLDFVIKIKTAFPEVDIEWLILGGEKKAVPPEEAPSNSFTQISNTPGLFDRAESDSEKIPPMKKPDADSADSANPNRIILFFPDGTFQSFVPNNN